MKAVRIRRSPKENKFWRIRMLHQSGLMILCKINVFMIFILLIFQKKIDAFIKSTPQILNDKEPVHYNYQALYDYYDSIPQKLHDFNMKNNLNSNLNMISDADDLGMNSDTNVSPNEKQSFMDMSKEQTGDIGEHVDIPSMDGSHHQPSTASLVSPVTVGDDCAPNITDNL
ncbi:hypothetical protein EUTSA_v10002863mg [Eutrema salsugineum]|uniref:Uncharacterized protein n=1 Tax=Eutrema salsugineum TaxID=72664 RepID=V4MXV3_EUTSA|nr:hypothetical protein EUTSA_v10002863mg [Eutrema salsugineum]